jgi:hypothetical protein
MNADELEIEVGDRVRLKGDIGTPGFRGPTWATVYRADRNPETRRWYLSLAVPTITDGGGDGFMSINGIDPDAVTTEDPEPIGGEEAASSITLMRAV